MLVNRGKRVSAGPAAPARQPRFVYLTEFDLSLDNGHGINEREFVVALRRRFPDDVVCVAPYPARPDVHFDPAFEYVLAPRTSAARYAGFLAAAFTRVRKLSRRHPIAALVCRLGATPVLPFAIQRTLGLPVILKTLALYSRFAGDASVRGSRTHVADRVGNAGALLMPVYRSLLASATYMDTVTVPYAAWLSERFGVPRDRLHVIPNGYNAELFAPGDRLATRHALGLDRFDRIVGYVGALTGMRHLEHLIVSFARATAGTATGLVLVGAGNSRKDLERIAAASGAADRVVFAGAVPYADVSTWMRAFDVAVDLTLVTMPAGGTLLHSSFSQKIPQYLGSGVPVVAWETGDTKFLAERRIGSLVPVVRPEALAPRLMGLLERPAAEHAALTRRAVAFARAELAMDALAARRVHGWRAALGLDEGRPTAAMRDGAGNRGQRVIASPSRNGRSSRP